MGATKPLTGEELRDARDFLVEKIADQAAICGGTPNVTEHQKFVEPIIRKVEVDHETERLAIALRPIPGDTPGLEHLPREPVGVVEFDTETGAAELLPGARLPVEDTDPPGIAIRRKWFRMLRRVPEYRALLEGIVIRYDRHMAAVAHSEILAPLKAEMLRALSVKRSTEFEAVFEQTVNIAKLKELAEKGDN